MTHTPGPWAIRETDALGALDPHHIYITPGVAVIERTVTGAADMANAELIAAAPDMLAALQWFVAQMKDDGVDDMGKLVEGMLGKADAAIAKAQGTTKAKPQRTEAHIHIDALRRAGFRPRSYSGRGMFGKECVGVSVDRVADLDGLDLDEVRTDSLGLGIIAYWPNLTWTDALEG